MVDAELKSLYVYKVLRVSRSFLIITPKVGVVIPLFAERKVKLTEAEHVTLREARKWGRSQRLCQTHSPMLSLPISSFGLSPCDGAQNTAFCKLTF